MKKETIISTRDNLLKDRTLDMVVMIDENYKFSTRNSYLKWDDTKEVLTVISPLHSPSESPDSTKQIAEVTTVNYDNIVYISGLVNVEKHLRDILSDLGYGSDGQKNILDHFAVLRNDEYYMK